MEVAVPVPPAAKGLTIHYEAGYLDFTSLIWPMPSSDVWTTKYP